MSPIASVFLGRRLLRGRAGTGRYLRGAVLGIALSLVPLVLVLEVSTGMIEGITARLLEVASAHLQASLPATAGPPVLRDAAAKAAAVPGVVAATAERQGTVLLSSAAGAAGITLRCVDPGAFARDEGLHRYISVEQGSLDLSPPRTVLLSAALARTLDVEIGDELLAVTTAGGDFVGLPRLARLSVGGIYATGYQELDRVVAYASLDEAAAVLPPRGSRALLALKVTDPFGDLAPLQQAVQAALGPDARVAGWRDLERSRLASFDTTRALLLFIMALIVVVAAANVSSAVLTLVLERRADIAALAAIGAKPGTLKRTFLLAGLGIGAAGTAIGLALGLVLAVNVNEVIAALEAVANLVAGLLAFARSLVGPGAAPIPRITLLPAAYYLQQIPVRIGAVEVLAAGAGTLLVAGLAAWLPAAHAGRLAPLEVLRRS